MNVFDALSIHFPLTREDTAAQITAILSLPFNPLPSHEGRLITVALMKTIGPFNPLPSHEGRLIETGFDGPQGAFNPLPSHEGRLRLFKFPSR